jgi:hypothetical protein
MRHRIVKHRVLRRTLAFAAIIAGAALMWLSSDELAGAIALSAGIALEILGIWLDHQARAASP